MARVLRRGLAVILLGCLAPLPAGAADPQLQPFLAQYRLSRGGIAVGTTEVGLALTADGGYRYHAHTEPSGPVSLFREDDILEESSGHIRDARPRPDRYRYRRSGSEIERSLDMDFDWERQRVRISGQGDWSLEIPPGTLDKLVQQLAFCLDLAAGAHRASYRVADGGLLKDYSYRVLVPERVETPHGGYETLKIDRRKGPGASDYTLWLAPELNYLPVRILRRHGGTRYLMELERLETGRISE